MWSHRLIYIYKEVSEDYIVHLSSGLKMKAAFYSETSVPTWNNTRCPNREHVLNNQLREGLEIFILVTWAPKDTFHCCVSVVLLQISVPAFSARSTIRLSTCLMTQTHMIAMKAFYFHFLSLRLMSVFQLKHAERWVHWKPYELLWFSFW
jgi:hypothetical protein